MKLVIEIPEGTYDLIKHNVQATSAYQSAYYAIRRGTVLPKGHGDLVDKSKIRKAIPAEEDNCTGMGMTLEEMDAYNEGVDAMYSLVQHTPTIIEADKEEAEE